MAQHWQRYSFRRTRAEGQLTDEALQLAFAEIDSDSSGFIESCELDAAVSAWAKSIGEPKPKTDAMLAFADHDGDGRISISEFMKVMRFEPPTGNSTGTKKVSVPSGGGGGGGRGGGASLEEVFAQFCSFGSAKTATELDNAKWAKLCKDSGLVDKLFSKADVDLTFSKVVQKGKRKMAYPEFVEALRLVAAKKGCTEQEVGGAVAAAAPSSSGTQADGDAVLAHFTDSSQYTGAHKHRFDEAGRGKGLAGRDSVAKGQGHVQSQGLAGLADRSPADVRGVKL